jgi:phospholipase/carboxylesterase
MKAFIITILFFTSMITSTKSNDTTMILHYLVRDPKIKSEHPPVLILLHGVGSNEEDLFSFANQLPEKYLVVSARAPISLGGNSFAWYQVDFSSGKPVFNFQQEEESRAKLINFISRIKEKYSANSKEIYLCGFSQGAIMSYSVGLTRPDLVKGIAVMSGRLLEEIKPFIAPKDKLQQLKVFISHGTNDNTLQINYARQSVAYLKSLNIIPAYKEYQEGHAISNDMLTDLILWLK